ncbi:MAG: hypBA1 3 [Segetibacter sp.]|nr:hypBA1 3 [Segetibacter sp.]
MVDRNTPVNAVYKENIQNGVTVLTAKGVSAKRQLHTDALLKSEQEVVAVPYYTWANRGTGEIMLWVAYEESASKPKSAPTVASAVRFLPATKTGKYSLL